MFAYNNRNKDTITFLKKSCLFRGKNINRDKVNIISAYFNRSEKLYFL